MKEGKAACSLTKNSLAKLKWSNFTARPLIKLLFESSFWFIDGFFKISIDNYKQMLIIGFQKHNCFVPCAYFLTNGCSTEVYVEFLEKIRRKAKEVNLAIPDKLKIMADFESPIRRAVNYVFDVDCFGCFFHYKQAIYRKLKSIGKQAVENWSYLLDSLNNIPFYSSALNELGEKTFEVKALIVAKMFNITPVITTSQDQVN